MKITKSKLKQIIKEELENAPGGADPTPPPEDVQHERDVDLILTYIKRIDQPKEYEQLLNALIQHGSQVRSAKLILTRVKNDLVNNLRKMK